MPRDLNESKVGITVYPAKHPAEEWTTCLVETADDLLRDSCLDEGRKSKQILASSFKNFDFSSLAISASSHGFVRGVFDAYCGHHHLIIRPEDVWFAILTQLSFYVNANAEELRHHFVAHEGQKEVRVGAAGTIYTVDIGKLAVRLTSEMDKFIVDRELKDWILPNFTTTTPTDTVVAAVTMMGTMQTYFKYLIVLGCGIPSVTLLGSKQDWISIRLRLNKLASFGEESQRFGQLLMPVLDNLVQTFDSAATDSKRNDFWEKVCHRESGGSGPSYLSGWITAFCFWDEKGKLTKTTQHRSKTFLSSSAEEFDSSIYPQIDTNDIPNGFTSVPVTVDDNGEIYLTRMVAGSIGLQGTRSCDPFEESVDHRDRELFHSKEATAYRHYVPTQGLGLDTIKPVLGWWMYELKETEPDLGAGGGKTSTKRNCCVRSCHHLAIFCVMSAMALLIGFSEAMPNYCAPMTNSLLLP
ncbi:MAG: hypothetical protein GOMPHAMPRED_000591 [Gomphillus americanus]|uniref:Uncharacterized protein n=1 Tax=Gomphillus americanus TaxID=1940652 RepID=A0A8H3ECB0_9LECA|nr:MAG: hypothetical protein GOMPHAMPRED_000591 [Gomphillus americanus]